MPISQKFRDFIESDALPKFSTYYKYRPGGFRTETINLISEHDATWFLAALECRVVIHKGHFFDSARSAAKEYIFWPGSKTTSPRSITLWLEPIISMGAAGRLHREFGWPIGLVGLQSKRPWAFDLVADLPSGELGIACEVKKDRREVDELIDLMTGYAAEPPLQLEPDLPKSRNAYRKVVGLRELRPPVFWALGPDGYGKVFEVLYPPESEASLTLRETSPEALGFNAQRNQVVTNDYSCPICERKLRPASRYPRYVCPDCAGRALGEDGGLLVFDDDCPSSADADGVNQIGGSFKPRRCWVDGIECLASEAYFGGVVIEVAAR